MSIITLYTAVAIIALGHVAHADDYGGFCDGFIRTRNTTRVSKSIESINTKSQGIDCEIANLPAVS